jgi:Tol biopolymer transport system component
VTKRAHPIAFLTVSLVATTGVACGTAGSDDAPKGRIAFTIPVDGEWRPAIANADGSGDPTVLPQPVEPGWAEWSPDGKKIAFNHDDFLVVNADGTGLRQVADSFQQGFAWAPDGDQIATLEGPELYVVDADGTDRRLISRGQGPLESVSWSPDGRTIAYTAYNPDEGYRIHLADSDGTGKRALTLGSRPSWSPDGNLIAFGRTLWPPYYVVGSTGEERERPSSVYVIDNDGGGERRLGRGNGPLWSPDGSRIAFTRDRAVYVIDSDGGGERRIGRGDTVSWSPSGTHIAVLRDSRKPSGPRSKTAIWVLNVDGSGERRIWPRRGLCECSSPAWLPD